MVAGWLLVLGMLVGGIFRRRRDLSVPVAALCSAILAVLHSLIDFSLQIPGYAIVVFAIVGAGLAQSFPSRTGSERRPIADQKAAEGTGPPA